VLSAELSELAGVPVDVKFLDYALPGLPCSSTSRGTAPPRVKTRATLGYYAPKTS